MKYKLSLICEVNAFVSESMTVKATPAHDTNRKNETWIYNFADYVRKHGTEIKEPVTYKYGDRFHDKVGDECMIIRLSENECILAATTGNDRGNRYRDTAVHVHFVDAITQEELDCMAGPAYAPLTKIEEE